MGVENKVDVTELLSELSDLERYFMQSSEALSSKEELDALRIELLGRSGRLAQVFKKLGQLPADQRPLVGKRANELRDLISQVIEEKQRELARTEAEKAFMTFDPTLPGRIPRVGKEHVVTKVINEIVQIFVGLGYEIAEGPEVELDYYNFEALNTPKDHPARSLQDTFFISEEVLLRTHTSPVQIRYMESHRPPIYIVAPGKVYRRDYDISHTPMFHQIEGLAVDRGISFCDLKGTLEVFAKQFFGEGVRMRLRPHYFPFTEPSAEVDISCVICGGRGCSVCSNSGWIEILGAGMVHPQLFKRVGYDDDLYTGFAFGMGIERIAMLRYGINDIRLMFENDLRFLAQF